MSSWPLLREGVETAPTATVLSLPQTPELLWPLLAVVPMQILAYQMAALKGVHPDTFRRDTSDAEGEGRQTCHSYGS
jgi:glucosamine 6-phosphate synthetase-like amidotransferase/phosphosugar isomerase protein